MNLFIRMHNIYALFVVLALLVAHTASGQSRPSIEDTLAAKERAFANRRRQYALDNLPKKFTSSRTNYYLIYDFCPSCEQGVLFGRRDFFSEISIDSSNPSPRYLSSKFYNNPIVGSREPVAFVLRNFNPFRYKLSINDTLITYVYDDAPELFKKYFLSDVGISGMGNQKDVEEKAIRAKQKAEEASSSSSSENSKASPKDSSKYNTNKKAKRDSLEEEKENLITEKKKSHLRKRDLLSKIEDLYSSIIKSDNLLRDSLTIRDSLRRVLEDTDRIDSVAEVKLYSVRKRILAINSKIEQLSINLNKERDSLSKFIKKSYAEISNIDRDSLLTEKKLVEVEKEIISIQNENARYKTLLDSAESTFSRLTKWVQKIRRVGSVAESYTLFFSSRQCLFDYEVSKSLDTLNQLIRASGWGMYKSSSSYFKYINLKPLVFNHFDSLCISIENDLSTAQTIANKGDINTSSRSSLDDFIASFAGYKRVERVQLEYYLAYYERIALSYKLMRTSFLIQPNNADLIRFHLKIEPLVSKMGDRVIERPYVVQVKGGWRLAFSTGIFVSGLVDYKYDVVDNDPVGGMVTSRRVVTENFGKWGFSFAALAHFYPRTGTRFNPTLTAGALVNPQSQFQLFVGLSLLFGLEQRFALNVGQTMGSVTRLSANVTNSESLPLGTSTVDTEKRFLNAWSFGVSYNLGPRNVVKNGSSKN